MECFWSDLSTHPQCPHGPTLLFGTNKKGELEKFYACAACRERKMCQFYLKVGKTLTKQQISHWEKLKKKYVSRYHHRALYLKFNEAMAMPPDKRFYCYNCEQLVLNNEKDELSKHKSQITDHDLKEGLTDYEMKHPTEILKPLENSKQEAQYFFTKQSTEDIVNILLKLGAKQVLCIGTPKVHEYILEKHEDNIFSLLLDFDARFHNFFGPLSYCWYNLMNNHFFDKNAIYVFKHFMTQNGGKDTYLICDPPFGSRVEPMSWTIKTISDLHKKWNNIKDESDCLKILFIFPYFMESIMKQKSNPPGIPGGLKDLKMTDYKVSYENHSLFKTNSNTSKLSPIRIFTNVPLQLFELPESRGYKYCESCEKWVAEQNKHCEICQECTSKNGLTYKHCNICKRCVKPYWKHCETCGRCAATNHLCGEKPKVTGNCFKCNKPGHTEKECDTDTTNVKEANKREVTDEEIEENTCESSNNELEHTEKKSSIKATKVKRVNKNRVSVMKRKVDSTCESKDKKLRRTEKKSSINATKVKKVNKHKDTDVKRKVDSTCESKDNKLRRTEKKSGINKTAVKEANKREVTGDKKLKNNVKKKKVDSTQELHNNNKELKLSTKSKIIKKKKPVIKVRSLKNATSLKMHNKTKLRGQSNGITKAKKR